MAQHLVHVMDFNFIQMHFLNHFDDYSRQLGNLFNASSELPERAMMNLKIVYWQSNRHETTFQNLQMKSQKQVFEYGELNANAAKRRRDNNMLQTKLPIKQIMSMPQPDIETLDYLAEWCAMP